MRDETALHAALVIVTVELGILTLLGGDGVGVELSSCGARDLPLVDHGLQTLVVS